MFLTTKGRYAVMAMLDMLEDCCEGKTVSIATMARRQQLSIYYLEQLFLMLKRAGLVVSVKGPGGGYKIARQPKEIFLIDILNAVGENIRMKACGEIPACKIEGVKCNSHALWGDLGKYLEEYFASTSLADVVCGNLFFKRKKV